MCRDCVAYLIEFVLHGQMIGTVLVPSVINAKKVRDHNCPVVFMQRLHTVDCKANSQRARITSGSCAMMPLSTVCKSCTSKDGYAREPDASSLA